jgi:hypothetical protein
MKQLCLVAALSLLACSPSAPTPTQLERELRDLFEADQAERSGPVESVDRVLARDTRRGAFRTLVAANVLGSAKAATSRDADARYRFHGLPSGAWGARRSEELDSTRVEVRWLVAAAWDRYQMSRWEPQWFGTQTTRVDAGRGALVLYDLDRSRVTDRERKYRGLGTLAELCGRLNAINQRLKLKSPGCLVRARNS